MAQQNILSGKAPVVWSSIDEAFQKINANFTELYLSIGGSGADLENLSSSLIPDSDQVRDLGSPTRRWRDLYLSASSLYLGSARITADQLGHVNLPSGSTVGGELIRNPSESNFKTIRIAGQGDIVANDYQGILNLSGFGVEITTDPLTDTVNFSNSGVTRLDSGDGININTNVGNITINNSGVISASSGTGISIDSPNGNITITNSGVTRLVAGSGIVLDSNTGEITITNSSPNIAQNVYRFFAVNGQPILDPTGPTTTLSILANSGISIISEPEFNRMTFSNTGVTGISVDDGLIINSGTGEVTIGIPETLQRNIIGDVHGSVFSDDSTLLIDGTEGKIVGDILSGSAEIEDLTVTNVLYSSSLSNPNLSQLNVYSAGTLSINSLEQMYLEISQAFAGDGASFSILAGSGSDETESMAGNGGNVFISAGHGPFGPFAVGGSVYISGGNGVVKGGDVIIRGGNSNSDVLINNLKYPRTDGTPGQILSTDGSGILNWIDFPENLGGGGGGGDFVLYVAADDSTQKLVSSGEIIKFIGGTGIGTASDSEGNITISCNVNTGNITFVGTTIDSIDSTGITFTPIVNFNSDVNVENDLRVTNAVYAKEIYATGAGTPELYSQTNIDLTAGTRVRITSSPLRLASFSTSERDALSAQNGDMIYNTTVNKFQGYQNGIWVDLS